MVLLEQYITLYERDSNLVFSAWKGIQIFIYAVAAVTGIIASYCISQLSESFGGNCILFSNVTFSDDEHTNGSLYLPIDIVKTEWGKRSACDFCQFVPVCSVIFAFVWATFFTMCGKGGKTSNGLSKPWRIVYPALLFNFTVFIVALVAAVRLQEGIWVFCNEYMKNNNESECNAISKYTLGNNRVGYTIFNYIVVAEVNFKMISKCCIWTVLVVAIAGDWVQLQVMVPRNKNLHDSDTYVIENVQKLTSKRPSLVEPNNLHTVISDAQRDTSLNVSHNSKSAKPGSDSEATVIKITNNEVSPDSINNLISKYNFKVEPSTVTYTAKHLMTNISISKDSNIHGNITNKENLNKLFTELPIDMFNSVHRTLLLESADTAKGKMNFLQQLKDKLFNYMELRIKNLLSREDRQARTDKGMGIPSMEGALMTICFLIFAVFLVKLVQQLIQCLQGTTTNSTVMMGMTPMTPMATMGGRRRRSITDILTTARVLQLMEQFQLQHRPEFQMWDAST